MRRRVPLIVAGAVVAGVAIWAVFRPELLFVDKSVNEAPPVALASDAPSTALLSGRFHGGAHETTGLATVYETPGGRRVLRLTGFETSNGPDVRVLLVAAPDVTDNDTVKSAGSVELGNLKGNVGDQNYDIPDSVDLATHRAVTIWCNRFGVNFGTAPLAAPDMAAAPAPVTLRSGTFHGVAHETRGLASVIQLADGRRILRLTDFETSNGPDVRVLLVAAPDVTDNDTVKSAGSVELGRLKGNVGDQNYDIPAEVDLARFGAVTIWCNRFGVNFATAPLATSGARS